MGKHYYLFFILLSFSSLTSAQEIKQFQVADFDLRGNVKMCEVITDYGKEIFEFDVLGRLVKVTTQYNEDDMDVTSYNFVAENLVEKRMESYKDNILDASSSMAHFYTIDSTDNLKVKEEIISYDKEFVEVQEYQFDEDNRLTKIILSHENAVDEITVAHTQYKDENTKTYFENGIVQKSIRESIKKNKKLGELRVVLTKNYLDGEPSNAIEEIKDKRGLLVTKEMFQFDTGEKEFVSQEKHFLEYNEEGILTKETVKQGNAASEKAYIFQFDNNEEKNWVKKIITPENKFTTRKITYYPKTVADIEIPK
ncbi:MAG: hypothetical protein AAF039_09915 [Bacteroidota bacterium]